MRIKKLHIENIRNHEMTDLEFSPDINILYGMNGAGKTSVLEAISISSLSKSFLPVQDSTLIRNGLEAYTISLEAEYDLNVPYKISTKFSPGKKKLINSNAGDNLLPREIIGEMPLVVLSPDYKEITHGSPSHRREFLDKVLSQSSKIYMEEMLKLKKCIRQRNAILSDAKSNKPWDEYMLDGWTEMLIVSASEVIIRRKEFIDYFIPIFKKYYDEVSESKEEVSLEYAPDHIKDSEILESKEKIENHLRSVFEMNRDKELRRGTSLAGPQKDDINIKINGGLSKEYASQGQHKSLLIAIKFAEFDYLKEIKQETPIILLDDIFSELDSLRSKKVLTMLNVSRAQTFMTLTNREFVEDILSDSETNKYIKIENGKLIEE